MKNWTRHWLRIPRAEEVSPVCGVPRLLSGGSCENREKLVEYETKGFKIKQRLVHQTKGE